MRQNHTSSTHTTKSRTQNQDQPTIGVSTDAQRSSLKRPPRNGSALDGPALTGAEERANAERSRAAGLRMELAKGRARYDRPGHLAEAHAERLLHVSRGRPGRDEFALVFDSAAGDDFATELAEQAVTSMVGGGETWLDMVNAPFDEEEGGPFLETRGEREFALGPEADEDTEGFLREALPTLSSGNSVPFEGVRRRRRS